MDLDLRKAGRILMALNFVLTAGVVVAGADFFASDDTAPRVRNIRDLSPPSEGEADGKDIFRDYSAITGEKFRTRAESGRRSSTTARPGARSALENTLRVLGTMLSNNEAFNYAILEDIHSKKQHTVGVGDMVGSVEIVSIRSDEVEVLLHGEKTVLPLDWKASVPERGRSSKGRKSSRSGGSGKSYKQSGQRKDGKGGPEGKAQSSGAGKPASGNRDAVASHLGKMSPDLEKWWNRQSPEAQEKWKKVWLGSSPEERKKWEKRLKKMVKNGKNNIK